MKGLFLVKEGDHLEGNFPRLDHEDPIEWKVVHWDKLDGESQQTFGYYDQPFLATSRSIKAIVQEFVPDICCMKGPAALAFVSCQAAQSGSLHSVPAWWVEDETLNPIPEYFPEKQIAAYCRDFAIESGVRIVEDISTAIPADSRLPTGTVNPKKEDQTLPLVSIVVPHYNGDEAFAVQLESLSNQTYANKEVIILDDGSTDPASLEQWSHLQEKFAQPEFKFHRRQENRGISATRNEAVNLTKGEWLLFCDVDNRSYPEMVETLVSAGLASEADVVTSWCRHFIATSDGEQTVEYYAPLGSCVELGWCYNVFGDANSLFRRSAFLEVGGFKTPPKTAGEDWILLARMVLGGYHLTVLPEPLFDYRVSETSYFRNSNQENLRRAIRDVYAKAIGNSSSPYQELSADVIKLLQDFLQWRSLSETNWLKIQSLEKMRKEQNSHIQKLQSDYENCAKEAERIWGELQEVNKLRLEQVDWIRHLEKDISSIQEQNQFLDGELQEVNRLRLEQVDWIRHLEKDISSLQEQNQFLDGELQEVNRLRLEQADWIRHLEKNISFLQEQNKSLNDWNVEKVTEVRTIWAQLQEANQIKTEQANRIAGIEAELEAATLQRDHFFSLWNQSPLKRLFKVDPSRKSPRSTKD